MNLAKLFCMGLFTLIVAIPAIACDKDEIKHAEDSITHYLSVRPMAADTAPGIHYTWIAGNEDVSVSCTVRALENLEIQGYVERARAGENTIVWRKKRNL